MNPPIVFINKQNKDNLVLFVHGFTSDSSTWINSKEQSLADMLMEESFIIENFDFAYFNYFTKLMDFKKVRFAKGIVNTLFGRTSKAKKNIGISSLSEFMESSIDIYCEDYKNIILVAHSMGGLISKSFILKSLENTQLNKIRLFLSLAVPHKGSEWADIGQKLAKKNPQVIDLKPMSDFLDLVNENWIQKGNTIPKTVYYYGQFDEIVDKKSAISFQYEKQNVVACNYDHFDITKPESTESIVYKGIRKNLLEFINDQKFQAEMKPKRFVDDGKLDDEIFVLKLLIADVHNYLIKDAKETFFDAEYMLKAIVSNGYSLDDLNELYRNLERLYGIYFVKFVDGEIKSSNELVTTIYEKIIERDKEFLKSALPLIDANKKTGMLNQLANNLDKEIWWAKDHCIKDIEDFRKARDSYEK
jgi:hypothetical protein